MISWAFLIVMMMALELIVVTPMFKTHIKELDSENPSVVTKVWRAFFKPSNNEQKSLLTFVFSLVISYVLAIMVGAEGLTAMVGSIGSTVAMTLLFYSRWGVFMNIERACVFKRNVKTNGLVNSVKQLKSAA